MPIRESLTQTKERVVAVWTSLEKWQKGSLVGGAFLVLLGIGLLVMWAGKPAYEPIFSGLQVEDQSAVVNYLKEQKIPYRSEPAANAILVPRANVYEARLALASMGIPKGGIVGYEIFDQSKMGKTDLEQRVALFRAKEGELARTISQIDAVEYARVMIVVPEQRLFLEQSLPSTASVMVKLKPGREIGQEQVKAIVHLVARSVEGLNFDDVTVVDTTGKVLSDLIEDGNLLYTASDGRTVTSVQRELERQQEAEFERRIRQILEKVHGPGKAVVKVRVELDFDKKSLSHKEYIPLPNTNKGVVRSSQNIEENYTGPGIIPGGAPGTTTNIPGYVLNSGMAGGNVEYNRGDNVTNYDITTKEFQQVVTPGAIRRLSASVILDGQLSDQDLARWRDSVAAVVGFLPDRGDQIVVQSMPFDTSFSDALRAEAAAEQRRKLIIGGLFVLLILLLLGVGIFLWLRKRRYMAQRTTVESSQGQVPSLRDLLENPDLMTAQGELAVLEEQLKTYAQNNPKEVAELVKNWLVEDV